MRYYVPVSSQHEYALCLPLVEIHLITIVHGNLTNLHTPQIHRKDVGCVGLGFDTEYLQWKQSQASPIWSYRSHGTEPIGLFVLSCVP